jgi:hypothetical protein
VSHYIPLDDGTIGEHVDGKGRGLIVALSRTFLGRTWENHEYVSLNNGVPVDI